MRACLVRAWFVLVCSCGLASTASAQDDGPDASADAEARGLFEAGAAAYLDARFEDALGHFTRAYELAHRATLLYNIGLTHERLGHDAEALDAYRRYLAEEADAVNARDVEARIQVMEQREAERRDRGAAEPTGDRSGDGGGGLDVGGLVLTIAGGVVMIAGGVFLGLSAADQSTLDGAMPGASWTSLEGTADRIPIFSGIGLAALGVGLAATALGVVLLVSSGGDGGSGEVQARVSPFGLALAGRL